MARPVYTEEWTWTSQRGSNPFPIPTARVTRTSDTETRSKSIPTQSPAPVLTVISPLLPNLSVVPTMSALTSSDVRTPVHSSVAPLPVSTLQYSMNDIDDDAEGNFFSLNPVSNNNVAPLALATVITASPEVLTEDPAQSSTTVENDQERGRMALQISLPNQDLMAAMIKLGIPFIDYAFLGNPPVAHSIAQRDLFRAVGGGASLGRRLLECMYTMLKMIVQIENQIISNKNDNSNLLMPSTSTSTSTSILAPSVRTIQINEPLLQFNNISESERTLFLTEILISSRAKPFSMTETNRLKSLPLFTVRPKGSQPLSLPLSLPFSVPLSLPFTTPLPLPPPIAINDCPGGAYWCDNIAVLDGIVYPSSTQGTLHTCLSVYLSICLYVCLSVCLSI